MDYLTSESKGCHCPTRWNSNGSACARPAQRLQQQNLWNVFENNPHPPAWGWIFVQKICRKKPNLKSIGSNTVYHIKKVWNCLKFWSQTSTVKMFVHFFFCKYRQYYWVKTLKLNYKIVPLADDERSEGGGTIYGRGTNDVAHSLIAWFGLAHNCWSLDITLFYGH